MIDGGAAAAIGYGAAMWVLYVGVNHAMPIGWRRHVVVVGAFLVALSTLAAVADRHAPARSARPGAELLAAACVGGLALGVASIISQVTVRASVDPSSAAIGVLGAMLAATGCLCRFALERPGRSAGRVVLVLTLVMVGATLARANYAYTSFMIDGLGMEQAASSAWSSMRPEPAWFAHEVAPSCLALALPTLCRALSWGLPAQVLIGMAGTAGVQRALELKGIGLATQGAGLDVEVLAGGLVPVACALAALWPRHARPTTD